MTPDTAQAALSAAMAVLGPYRPFLWGGTLLGCVRENRILPWDGDIDLGLLADDLPDPLLPGHEFVRHRFAALPWMAEYGVTQGNVGLLIGGVKVGLHLMGKAGEWRFYTFHERLVQVPDPAPLAPATFIDVPVHLPADPDAALEWLYGDWHMTVRRYNRSPEERAAQARYLVAG